MKKFIIIISITVLYFNTLAQDKVKDSTNYESSPALIFKFAPLALINVTTISLQPSVEVNLYKNIAWIGEFNYYLPGVATGSSDNSFNPYEMKYNTGYRIKNQIRIYISDNMWQNGFESNYIAFEHYYKKLDNHQNVMLADKENTHYINTEITRRDIVNSYYFVFGKQRIGIKSKIGIDAYFGAGVRYKMRRTIDIAEGYTYDKYENGGNWFTNNDGNFLTPSLTAGFRICFQAKETFK